MKKLNLSSYGVEEMSQQEMLNVEGGCKLWNAICDAAEAVAGAIVDAYQWAVGHSGNKLPANCSDFTDLGEKIQTHLNSLK
jgi:lactobin A/cerein 7B family class IIb bacteriocin